VRKIWLGFGIAITALAGSILPSGAGQHFGVLGSDGGTFVTGNAFGPEGARGDELSASGVFVRGALVDVRDGSATRSSLYACVSVKTAQGRDHGCVSGDGFPQMSDPMLSSAELFMTIPSSLHQGGFIEIELLWSADSPFEPQVSFSLPDGQISASVAAGIARRAIVTGTIRSSAVGGGPINADGFLTRGTSVRACSSDTGQAPC